MSNLAIKGGIKAIKVPLPHEVWPPDALNDELKEISKQRNTDISIRGRVGPIKELEEDFRKFLNNKVDYLVSFNSGTSALLAAYFALNINENDEVIGSALTYHAALSPVYFLKGSVVLADIDIKTRCIDSKKIERLITDRTKVITVVHQWGHPVDMDAILKIKKKYKLKLIEDCSHAHGSKYKGKLCGTFGDIAVFSLQTNKMVFAGEGGILVTNNKELYDRATLLGHYRNRSREEIDDEEYQKYWVTGFGLKLRMSPFNAIVAKHSLKHFKKRVKSKHKCLNYFRRRLEEVRYIDPPYVAPYAYMGAWYGFKPLYKKERLKNLPREELLRVLRAEGMEISVPSGPVLASLPLYSESPDLMFPSRVGKYVNEEKNFPVAQKVEDEALSLPTFWDWEKGKIIIDQYIDAFKKVEENIGELV
ncbi:MAG: aminotransferase class V-fold PLP-dependent enzyme [Candidatus Curtissbacteria bacterium]